MGNRLLRPLTLPLAGRTTASGPIGAQSLAGMSMLLVNSSGQTLAWLVYDDERAPVRFYEQLRISARASEFFTLEDIALLRRLGRAAA